VFVVLVNVLWGGVGLSFVFVFVRLCCGLVFVCFYLLSLIWFWYTVCLLFVDACDLLRCLGGFLVVVFGLLVVGFVFWYVGMIWDCDLVV